MKPEYELRAEREREIISTIDGLLVSICFLSYIVCVTLGFIPKITGDELLGVTTMSWFCSMCMAFSLSQKFDGFSSPEMSSKFRQRLTILFFIYLTGVMVFFMLTIPDTTERIPVALSLLPIFASAALGSRVRNQ